jgi:hypothetical protein
MLSLCNELESALKRQQIEAAKLTLSQLKGESVKLLLAVEQANII